jgi:hypothetical protein
MTAPVAAPAPHGLCALPTELLFCVAAQLDAASLHALARTSSRLRSLARADALWAEHVAAALRRSPPAHSHTLTPIPLASVPEPSDARFRTVGTERWLPTRTDAEAVLPPLSAKHAWALATFPEAASLHEVWGTFVRPWAHMLGWWAAELPTYGYVMRVVFDAAYDEALPASADAESSSSAQVPGPAFVAQKLYPVNRLEGLVPSDNEGDPAHADDASWAAVNSFRMPVGARISPQGSELRAHSDVDLVLPSVKTCTLWTLRWSDICAARSTGEKWRAEPRRCFSTGEAPEAEEASGVLDLYREGQRHLFWPASRAMSSSPLEPTEAQQHGRMLVQTLHGAGEPSSEALRALEQSERQIGDALSDVHEARGTPRPPLPFPSSAVRAALRHPSLKMRMSPLPPRLCGPRTTRPPGDGALLTFSPLVSPPRTPSVPPPRRLPLRSPGAGVEYEHLPPPPGLDPALPDFDWSSIEGLWAMEFGPWGVEVLHVRSRILTADDFVDDPALKERLEPRLSADAIYHDTQIQRAAVRVGVRVVEAIKVTGDLHIPRGQLSFRAFVDDPARVATPWCAPPPTVRCHTPWPYRAPAAPGSSQETERSPGLACPGHGRLADEGFLFPGWVACIVSSARVPASSPADSTHLRRCTSRRPICCASGGTPCAPCRAVSSSQRAEHARSSFCSPT